MATDIRQEFAQGVLGRYRTLGDPLAKSLRPVAFRESSALPVGHPDYHHLALGDSASCEVVVAFLDMARFTARSFWEPPEKVSRLALAVLTQLALVVQESGGHVLGLRGDGLMAGWGSDGSDPEVDVMMCMAACAVSLDAGQGALNELLVLEGIEPVQLRVGADHGRVDFVRTGTAQQSEVNVVGFAANFAAKCEKYAHSWEVVIGEGAAAYVGAPYRSPHPKSPKQYEYRGQHRTYDFHDVAWAQIVIEGISAIREVSGTPTSSVRATY